MTLKEKQNLYARLLHAMQTGVAFSMDRDDSDCKPKHLRVGINSALIDSSALARLLIKNNIITEDAYWDSLIEVAKEEVESYKRKVNELYGTNNISLDGF